MSNGTGQHPNAPFTPEGRWRMVACVLDRCWSVASRTVSLSLSPLVSVRAVMTISTIRIPPVIRTQRRRQNGGLSDPSPPSSSSDRLTYRLRSPLGVPLLRSAFPFPFPSTT